MLTQPEDVADAAMNGVASVAAMGRLVEHSSCMVLQGSGFEINAEDLRKHIDAAGIDQTILCSDPGQTGVFHPLEGFHQGVRLCTGRGHTDDGICEMVSLDTARVIGLWAGLPQA